jgi:hypothetical protein
MFNANFNNISVISWWSILLVKETGVLGENQRHVESHWQTLSHNVVSSTPHHEQGSNSQMIGTDCIGSCESIYNTITTTIAPNQSFLGERIIFIYYHTFFSPVNSVDGSFRYLNTLNGRFWCIKVTSIGNAGFQTRAPHPMCQKGCFLFYIFGTYIFVYFK